MPSRSNFNPAAVVRAALSWSADDPIRDGQGRVTLGRFMERGFGRREILGVALFSQLNESTVLRRMVSFCRR